MGCGCGKRQAAKTTSTSVRSTNRPEPAKADFLGNAPKAPKGMACPEKYSELAILDRKVIALHKKFRFSQVGFRYAEAQKVIRGWISGLSTGCPDEDELKDYKQYINEEYSKYFNADR